MFLVSYDGSYLGRNIFVPNFVPQVEKKTVTYHCRSSNEKVLALPPCTEFRKIQNTHKMVRNPIGILYYFFPLFFFVYQNYIFDCWFSFRSIYCPFGQKIKSCKSCNHQNLFISKWEMFNN